MRYLQSLNGRDNDLQQGMSMICPMSLEIVQIIEDDPLHARLRDHSLRHARYRTNVAGDGVTGLADVRRLHPSVVILDLTGMPDLIAMLRASPNERT
jgi:CheY-like chemotaxis protein